MSIKLIPLFQQTLLIFICSLSLASSSIAQLWIPLGADIDGEAVGDQSGSNVSLSADGTRVAIGAIGNDDNGSNSGHVRIYEGFIPDPIPTMSQWALFILGLSLTSLAVVTIRKRILATV